MQHNEAFLAIIRGGLWNTEVRLSLDDNFDYGKVLGIAENQSVVGILTAGVENLPTGILPLTEKLTLLGKCQLIEQRNEAMNRFIAGLVKRMRDAGIKMVLVKGQGVAQCYERPLWRSAGDIDLLLDDENYNKAKALLSAFSEKAVVENVGKKHLSVQIKGFTIELHGRMPFALSRRADRVIDEVVADTLLKVSGERSAVRVWRNENTDVYLPNVDNDVIIVFTHFLNHFFIEGVGLKQICDWCRLLWTYKDELDRQLLQKRLYDAGLMSEWKVFASIAVITLGMPQEVMPFYDDSPSYRRKAKRVLSHILKSGNLGHNKDVSYREKYSVAVSNIITLFRRLADFLKFALVFPIDSPKFFTSYIISRVV